MSEEKYPVYSLGGSHIVGYRYHSVLTQEELDWLADDYTISYVVGCDCACCGAVQLLSIQPSIKVVDYATSVYSGI